MKRFSWVVLLSTAPFLTTCGMDRGESLDVTQPLDDQLSISESAKPSPIEDTMTRQPGDDHADASADFDAGAAAAPDSVAPILVMDSAPDPTELRKRLALESLPKTIRYPPKNRPFPERVALGRLLFFDPILSGERDVACATCHHPDLAWADGRQLPVGVAGGHYHPFALGPDRVPGTSAITDEPVGLTPRNAPTVLNTAFNGYFSPHAEFLSLQFWDGRVENGLEEQALKPPTSRVEMAGDAYSEKEALEMVVARLGAVPEYWSLFNQAFPETPSGEDPVSAENLGFALAAFQRELVTPDAPFDLFCEGVDDALTPAQLRGIDLFFGKAACGTCHMGPMLSNFDFHVQGVAHVGPGRPATPGDDIGRGEVTGEADDMYAFRTPSLRNVELTAPYMHNGALLTLSEVVEFYDRGGNDFGLDPVRIDPLIFELGLEAREKEDLVAFMISLTGELPDVTVPDRVPSGLTPVFGQAADMAKN